MTRGSFPNWLEVSSAQGRGRRVEANLSGGWVYILTNRPNGTLYVGVTSDLPRRIWEHREGVVDGFTRRYNLKRLVHAEVFDTIEDAIRREKTLKTWLRDWKVELITAGNPEWRDLYDELAGGV